MRRIAILAATVAGVLSLAGPAAAAVRHASPAGVGASPCVVSSPCSFTVAVQQAGAGDEVVVAPGTHVLPATAQLTADGVTVHGPVGGPRPVVRRTGGSALLLFGINAQVRDLRFESHDAGGAQLVVSVQNTGALIERVEAIATGTTQYALNARATTVRDSVLRVRDADFGRGLIGGPGVSDLVNVTVIADGANGNAVNLNSCFATGSTMAVRLTNVIARAGGLDLETSKGCDAAGSSVVLELARSNFDGSSAFDGSIITLMAGNQTSPPVFVNAAAGDLRQLGTSPTVDAGGASPFLGSLDLDGQPRTLGAAPDIGADELAHVPAVTAAAAIGVTTTGAALRGTLDPRGLPTTHAFEYGATAAYGSVTPSVAAGEPLSGARDVEALVSGLAPGTTYHYRTVAVNAAGTTVGADATLRTLPLVTPVPIQAPTTAPTPGSTPAPGATAKRVPGLRVTRVRLRGGRLELLARLDPATTGRVTIRLRAGSRSLDFTSAIGRTGRIRIERRLPSALRRVRRVSLTLAYAGDAGFRAAAVNRKLARR